MPRTMAYCRCGTSHVVLVHGVEAPSDDEWRAYLQDLERWLPEVVGIVVVTDGGGPTSSQRRAGRELMARNRRNVIRVAVVTDSLLARGIVNALNLFNPGIRSFRPEAIKDAIAHMGAALDGPAIIAEVDRLRQRFRG